MDNCDLDPQVFSILAWAGGQKTSWEKCSTPVEGGGEQATKTLVKTVPM